MAATTSMKPRIQALSTRIPEPLYSWMTAWCDRERLTIQEVVTDALLLYQEQHDPVAKARTVQAITPPAPADQKVVELEAKLRAQDEKLDSILAALQGGRRPHK